MVSDADALPVLSMDCLEGWWGSLPLLLELRSVLGPQFVQGPSIRGSPGLRWGFLISSVWVYLVHPYLECLVEGGLGFPMVPPDGWHYQVE